MNISGKSELKKLAAMAKLRMRNGYADNREQRHAYIPDIPLGFRKEDTDAKIAEMMAANVTNPLGLMMDKTAFCNMRPEQKDRYVLQLSKLYRYYCEKHEYENCCE